MADGAGAGRGCSDRVGWVGGDKGTGKELGRQEGEVVMGFEGLGICVKVVNARHLHAACRGSEGSILEGLDASDHVGSSVSVPVRELVYVFESIE